MSTFTVRPTRTADMRVGDRFLWEGCVHTIVDNVLDGTWRTTCSCPPAWDTTRELFDYGDESQVFDVIVGESA